MRKPPRLLTLLASLLPTLVLAAPTAMRLHESYPSTDVINVGANTIGALSTATPAGGQGTLVVSGLSGTVSKAWLYWKGIEFVSPANGFVGGNGTYDEPEIRFENQLIVGQLVADHGSTDCHPQSAVNIPESGAFYRADVTSFVQARGNGNYAFSGLSDGLESISTDSGAHSANGLSLVIYFSDGNSANNRRVDQYEGQLSNTEGTWDFEFPLNYIGGEVELILHVSDSELIFNDGRTQFITSPGRGPGLPSVLDYPLGVFADNAAKFAGASVPSMNAPRFPGLWDIRKVPITTQFGRSARYVTTLQQSFQNDCVSLQLVQVLSAPIADSPMLAPGTHDFGDVLRATQSPTQTFTFTNLWPHSLLLQNPMISSTSWYRLLSQNCSGQTLAPGASCQIAIACLPPAGSLPDSLPSAHVAMAWNSTGPQGNAVRGEVYSTLRCAGVPDAPFARLEFSPRVCLFTDTPVNNTVLAPPLLVRNTSTLSATITLAAVANNPGQSNFSMLSTSCSVGRVLLPNDTCEIRALFRAAAAPTISRGNAVVGFTSQVDPNARSIVTNLQATTIALAPTGAAIFQNGFEFGVAQCLE